jgi:hypothetical protein
MARILRECANVLLTDFIFDRLSVSSALQGGPYEFQIFNSVPSDIGSRRPKVRSNFKKGKYRNKRQGGTITNAVTNLLLGYVKTGRSWKVGVQRCAL